MESKLKAVRMESEMINKIEEKAAKENRTFSNMVKTLLQWALKNHK